jgi:hypothetical protein
MAGERTARQRPIQAPWHEPGIWANAGATFAAHPAQRKDAVRRLATCRLIEEKIDPFALT